MLRRLIFASLVSGAALGTAACGLFFDTDKLGASNAATDDEGGANGDASDAGVMTVSEAAPAPDASNGCPSGKGPPMVRIDDYCMDSTEVTGAEYAIFVAAMGPDAGGPKDLPQCVNNTSLGPVMQTGFPVPPAETLAYPVHGVDWCDAKLYCRWAGKDLCGAIAAKSTLAPADATDSAKSQWEKACSKNGTKRFAYSDSYMAGRCIDGEKNYSTVNKTCEGGYDGLYDLVGNVSEWIDACQQPLDPSTFCALMGGGPDPDELASCTSQDTVQGTIPWGNAGIRCCARVTP